MKKQLLLIVLLLSAAASAFAVEVEIDGLWYEVVAKAKEAKVIKYKNNVKYNGDIVIPETVAYEGVTCSVTSIGIYAFYNCSGLTSVTIPNSVTSIGELAFSGCSGLTSVTIGNSVTSIEYLTFYNCSGLTSVAIPNSVTSIKGSAFSGCSGLTTVNIPNSVTSIGSRAFYYCSSLTSATIPNGVTRIEERTFYGCSGLTSVTIPNSVTSIEDWAFFNCSGLTSIVIGGDVKTIDSYAFANCPELTDVTCYAENVPSTESNAFEGSNTEYATLHVPTASIDAYKTTVPWSGFKTIMGLDGTLPEGIANVPAKAVLIQSNGGQLTIEGANDGERITVYGINGTQAGSAISNNGSAVINTNLQPDNVAIVRIGQKSVKMMMK